MTTPPYATPEPTTQSAPAPGGPAAPAEEFFDRIRSLDVVRPDEGRWAAGVCAGLARRWGIDPVLVRGLVVVVSLVTGIGLGVYGVLWLLLPEPDGRIHAQQVLRGVVTAGFVGATACVLVDFPLSGSAWPGGGPWGFEPFGPVALVGLSVLGAWWLTRGRQRYGAGTVPVTRPEPAATAPMATAPLASAPLASAPLASAPLASAPLATAPPGLRAVPVPLRPDEHRPSHGITLMTMGLAVLAASSVLVWNATIGHVPRSAGLVALAAALAVVAAGIVVAGALGRRAGGLAPLAILLAIVTALGTASYNSLHDLRTGATWTPADAPPTAGYSLNTGRAVLDLTSPALARAAATAPVEFPVSVGAGSLVIIVPSTTGATVNASVGIGDVIDRTRGGPGRDHGGAGVRETIRSGGTPVIVVDAQVGVGQVRVVPQGTSVTP